MRGSRGRASIRAMDESLLLDEVMPRFDATRIEHRVIDAPAGAVYDAMLRADLVDAVRRNHVVSGLFAARAAAERVVSAVRGAEPPAAGEASSLRLADLPREGEWIRLREERPREFVFGVIGRFWAGETRWERTDAESFQAFDAPGLAKIAAGISLRPYGSGRTLASYEARTRATDEEARRAFLRYWTVVSPGVGMVMRSALAVVDAEALQAVARA
jgi:hypothetical protein